MKCFHAQYCVKIDCETCLETPFAPVYTLGAEVLSTTEVGLFFHTVLSFPKCVEAPLAFDPTEALEISEFELLDSLIS